MTAAAEARGLPFGRPLTRDDLDRVPYNGKCELFDGTLVVTREGYPFTRAELEATPDDGHRYEIIDGLLVVTPAPDSDHQGMLGKLYSLMTAACLPARSQGLFRTLRCRVDRAGHHPARSPGHPPK